MSQQEEAQDIKKKILSTGIRVGTTVKTTFMQPFITKASPEGLYMIDLDKTISRINTAAKFINRVEFDKILVCSGREYATTPIERFCEMIGTRKMLGRFMPGSLTNPSLPFYTEPKLVIITDPQVDSQAIIEATNAGVPVIGISNTDNVTSKIDIVIPANNRGRKSLATVFWLLAREILIQKGQLKETDPMKYEIDDFETKISDEEME
ncbi:MAG: 30S ribosomal protein S2 [Nitrososphaerota archaeon]